MLNIVTFVTDEQTDMTDKCPITQDTWPTKTSQSACCLKTRTDFALFRLYIPICY